MADTRQRRRTVLHVPFTYAPDPIGGTEVYVAALAAALVPCGIISVVAAPATTEAAYRHGGVDVHRFAVTPRPGLAEAQGEPDRSAAVNFARILETVRPDIVHLHAHTSAVSRLLLAEARRMGMATVVTYHTPTFSCMRGTLRHMGREVCDGRIRARRCAACTLAVLGVPEWAARLVAAMPTTLARAASAGGRGGRWRTALAVRAAADATADRFGRFTALADRVVAPARWVAEVLARNGVSEQRTVLVRQAAPVPHHATRNASVPEAAGPLRLAFYGRLSPTKGIDVLIAALASIPEAEVVLDLMVVRDPGNDVATAALNSAIVRDPRISLKDAVPPEAVVESMAYFDLVVVPSRWLETGPLVVLEAFAAGVPVLGSRLGGIAELVRDGVDGLLVPADDVAAWAAVIAMLAADRERVAALRSGVRPPRTMAEVATEMAAIYRGLAA